MCIVCGHVPWYMCGGHRTPLGVVSLYHVGSRDGAQVAGFGILPIDILLAQTWPFLFSYNRQRS